jgi:iron complex outermembrane receptor protein
MSHAYRRVRAAVSRACAQSASSARSSPTLLACGCLGIALTLPVRAQDATKPAADQLPPVTVEQKTLPPPPTKAAEKPKKAKVAKAATTPAAQPKLAPAKLPNALVNGGTPAAATPPIFGTAGSPAAQTATAIDTTRLEKEPVFTVSDILRQSPGVSLKQGNGPRDLGISIRGSNARNGFGIRNIVIFEDGFPVTQPDGLSRSDLIDPHAYAGVDVWRGPSSALFGNYATGGAINFRTRPGGEINGVEYGVDVGSFNYLNNYSTAGVKGANYEGSIFLSDVRGDGWYGYSQFNTQTANMLLTVQASPWDKITFKAIDNELYTQLPFRMSLNQFNLNPFQQGCATAATAAPGCAVNNFSATNTNPRVPQTAAEAGANRDDRRSIGGVRWEHNFDDETTGRVQIVVDDRNISQPTGTTSAIGDYLSYNVITDVTHRETFMGLPARYLAGAYWNYLPVDGSTFNVAPGGGAALGLLQSKTEGSTTSFGARARQEVAIGGGVVVTAGLGVERTWLEGSQRNFTYALAGATLTDTTVSTDRVITNVAPEVGLLWRPNAEWQYRARVGTGYGTPQFTNLFVTSSGVGGNNTDLKSQRNIGYDLGVDWTPLTGVMLSATGFYDFFQNELVTQSAGPGLLSFTFNAPRSQHRGVELAADVVLLPGLRATAAYLYDDQFYTDYDERLSGSATLFDRAGNKIPGVSPNELTARLSYDEAEGDFKGLGAFVEYQWHQGFFMENANLLQAPGYGVVDVNLHYTRQLSAGPLRSYTAYFEIRNLLDETYVSAANNITDAVGATPASLANVSGSIYTGAPRTYFGGFKVSF